MSDLSIAQVLAQIRTLSAQVGPGLRPAAPTLPGDVAGAAGVTASSTAQGPSFAGMLKQGIDAVNSTQQQADRLETAWERGDPGVNLANVMVEAEKASVSFSALSQVRNRLISVYQDIMNMSI
jgi:flagellar hook-basal body complex protein FliE